MAAFCLTKNAVQRFKEALKSGELDPGKMAEMTSEERNALLSKFVGEDSAKQVNALFESKLLLQSQKAGYISWAKKVAGITPEVRRDLISRIDKLDKVLNPDEEKQFLHDLASTKLGVDIKPEEAKQISDLSQGIKDAEAKRNTDGTFNSETERLDYGAKKVALYNYVNDLKKAANNPTLQEKLNPINVVSKIAGTSKAIKASLDNSAIFRQGWKTLWTNPIAWQRNARKSFIDIAKSLGGKDIMDGVMADIISRPTYDKMVKSKLAIGNLEEAFPTTFPEKIPLFGRLYKASEGAYTGFLQRQRADIFDTYLKIAEKSGVNINDLNELKPIASMVNSLTGRGNLGKLEGKGADLLNNVFFSPRYLKSEFDSVGHIFTGAGGSNFVRKQAAINLLKAVAGTAAILTIAHAINPTSVELDPRSSDFGKIKIGDTRFDVTGGFSSLATLAARLIIHSTKSASGNISELDTGKFGQPTTKDVIFNFATNKLSPAASFLLQLRSGTDNVGNKVTPIDMAKNLLEPLPLSNIEESLKDPKSANLLLTILADSLGIATNTYSSQKNWSQNPTKAQQTFLNKVGQDNFTKANTDFNKKYSDWLDGVSTKQSYKNLSQSDKQALQTKAKGSIENKTFKSYGFVYKQPQKTSQQVQKTNQIKKLTP